MSFQTSPAAVVHGRSESSSHLLDRRIARKELQQKLTQANAELALRQADLLSAIAHLRRSQQELENTQLHLAQVEKLATIGRLAAGIAHEVKNPLMIVSLGIDYLAGCGLPDQLAHCVVREMQGAVKRAQVVIGGLLDFSAPSRLDARPQDLHRVVGQSVSFVRHELARNHVVLENDFAHDVPLARLDAAKMEQVFTNLFLNAIHAMPEGGTLSVKTFFRRLTGVGSAARDGWDGGGVIVVEIEDTGTGVPEDKLSQLFDPFFTTKPAGIGTGLGLTVAKMLIELHGGTIQITNRTERGARVTLTLTAATATGDPYHGQEKETHPGG